MDYIIVRHRMTNQPPPARQHVFLDAVLVTDAESDGDALRAASDKVPQPTAVAWEVIPVTPDRRIDASP